MGRKNGSHLKRRLGTEFINAGPHLNFWTRILPRFALDMLKIEDKG